MGEKLGTRQEDGNLHDKYAVCVMKNEVTVGHVPREILKTSWHFIQHGGEMKCEVIGNRKHSSTPGKGLEVPFKCHLNTIFMARHHLSGSLPNFSGIIAN